MAKHQLTVADAGVLIAVKRIVCARLRVVLAGDCVRRMRLTVSAVTRTGIAVAPCAKPLALRQSLNSERTA